MGETNTSGGQIHNDEDHQGRESSFMDIDRMINEGLGGGIVTIHNGLVDDTTTDTMDNPESILNGGDKG